MSSKAPAQHGQTMSSLAAKDEHHVYTASAQHEHSVSTACTQHEHRHTSQDSRGLNAGLRRQVSSHTTNEGAKAQSLPYSSLTCIEYASA